MKRVPILIALFAASLAAVAQTTPVLIPTLYNGDGAFGSHWYTNVFITNTDKTIEGKGIEFVVQCPIPEGCFAADLQPNAVGSISGPQSTSGLLLHLPADQAEAIDIDVHFGESSRNSYGVQLPIARERDFRQSPFVLPLVPLLGEIRTALRIYSPDAIEGQQVRVELLPWWYVSRTPDGSIVVTLTGGDAIHPAYAQLDLQREFPTIFSGAERIRIVPLPMANDALPRIWAMATVVENATNEVSVFARQ